jgi:hypothetical protein
LDLTSKAEFQRRKREKSKKAEEKEKLSSRAYPV